LDAGLKDLDGRREIDELRRIAVNRPALALCRLLAVDRVAHHAPDPDERMVADGHGDRPLRVDDLDAAGEPVRRVHRDGANAVVPEMLLHLRDQLARTAVLAHVAAERVLYLRQPVREDGVEDDALDLDDFSRVLAVA